MKALIIEDDSALSCQIEECLARQDLAVEKASCGADALQLLGFSSFDVIILDWKLPDLDGIDLLLRYRKEGGDTPVLMLTGMNRIDDKVTGLGAGADDYLTKPFDSKELVARVQALLRRGRQPRPDVLTVGTLVIDTKLCRAAASGTVLQLRPKEYSLLVFMARHANAFHTAAEIHAELWRSDSETTPSVVRSWMHRLRTKLPAQDGVPTICYSAGRGYTLQQIERARI